MVALFVAVGAALVILQVKFNIFGKVFEAIGKLASKAWDGIKAGLSAIGDLASSIWDGLKSGFGGVVSVIKGYVSTLVGIYKGAFNGIASIWNNTVGKLSFTIPSWVPKIGGAGFSVPRIPELAEGGIVKARSGGTLALIGEGGSDEAVIPLSGRNMPNMGNNITINVNGGDPNAVVSALRSYMRTNGSVPIRVSSAY
jgi:phage-related protein